MHSRQAKLPGTKWTQRWQFGGSLLKGHARQKRPLSKRLALHLVLRSAQAKGRSSLLRHKRSIEQLIQRLGARHHVRIHSTANVGNHLHLVIQPGSRHGYCAFIRALTGCIARLALGIERGPAHPQGAEKADEKQRASFWDSLPFTRAVTWGREFRVFCQYMRVNRLEGQGVDRINAYLMLGQAADLGFG